MKREENQTVEYKESWHEKFLEWICGYANARGGTLYIGVEDKTKKPVGVRNANKLKEDIPNSVRNTMGIVADVALLKKQGKDVIRIKVQMSTFPVNYHGGYFYRTGSVKMQLVGNALTEFLMEKSGMRWDAAPTLGAFKRVDHAFTALLARYRKERKVSFSDSDFESFGLETSDGILTNTGALLADDCPLSHSRVFCTRWNGLTMAAGVMDAKDDHEYSGGILSLLRYAEDFVRVNSRHAWHKLPRSRVEFHEYPERAVHEALVNAFIHRDYIEVGSEVHVDMFDDRLEITSPGGMPEGRRVEDYDVHRIPSVRRNKLLADFCERLRLMERRGSGFKKIFEDYEKISENPGHRIPVIEAEPTYFRLTLPNLTYGFTDAQLVGSPVVTPVMTPVVTPVMIPVATPVDRMLTERHMRILLALKDGEMASSEIVNVIDGIAPNNLRRRYMRYLLDVGYVEYTIPCKPNSRAQKYRIAARGKEMLSSLRESLEDNGARLEDNDAAMRNSRSGMSNNSSAMSNNSSAMSNSVGGMCNNGVGMCNNELIKRALEPLKKRLKSDVLNQIVVDLCSIAEFERFEIAKLIKRDESYVRKILARLVKTGRVKMKYPEMPKHPHQTYRAAEITSIALAQRGC